jgi:hypothetical protein
MKTYILPFDNDTLVSQNFTKAKRDNVVEHTDFNKSFREIFVPTL